MIRDDLLEAQASVDWPLSRFLDLHQRLESWLKENVRIEIEVLPPPAETDPIIAIQKENLPLAFNVEVGAYVNAIRSSLDILAMALVQRHGLNIEPEKVQFPVAANEDAFLQGKYRGSEFVNMLPDSERLIINELRPYKGGQETIATLHHLDIVRSNCSTHTYCHK